MELRPEPTEGPLTAEELQLAARNRGLPLEALRYDVTPAAVEPPRGPFAWSRWTATWNAVPGEHVLSCRATDAAGNSQPIEPPWNHQGMGNNLVQRVEVLVR